MSLSSTVLVTGASRGIGRAIALRAAQDGWDVALHYHRSKDQALSLAQAITALGRQCRTLCFDIREREACARVLSEDIAAHGAYYGVVCNAGVARDAAFPALAGEDWDEVVHTNLDAFYNTLHPVVMPMVQRRAPARIITISSTAGEIGNRGQTNYSASKAGIIGATKALALELASRKITVNCIAPGLIETEMASAEVVERAIKLIPAARLGQPEEVAALAAFLLSPQAAYITRQVISINGGLS